MIAVGKRKIGAGEKPFIIAEVGSNWKTFEDCKNSISLAKACGADAVKFQLFGPRTLHGTISGEPDAWNQGYVLDLSGLTGVCPYLDPDWLPKLAEKAKACDIEFMCTAFSPELYDAVDPYVSIHKVASAELTHVRILEKLRKLGKPVILSTGASGEADIRTALTKLDGVPVILMYCVAAYPAKLMSPWLIPVMKSKYGLPVGYSDHSIDATVTPVVAASQGAVVIEKHVNFVGSDGPDAPHSLSTDEFKIMCKAVKGDPVSALGYTIEEKPMILRHNRRLIATRDIQPGQILKEGDNFGIYRSLKDDTHALHPFAIGQVIGRTAQREIKAGDGIGPGDFR